MLEHIVVLLDGSRLAESVLSHTRALAQVFGSKVTLLHVLEPIEKGERGRLDPVKWHLRKIEAQKFLRESAQGWQDEEFETETVLLEGSAANRIIEYVEDARPNLVMLSSHGHSGMSPWNINSVAAKIVERVPTSIMLIRAYQEGSPQPKPARYDRILVPLDLHKRAECVLPYASQLATSQDSELWLTLAVAPLRIMHRHTLSQKEEEALEQLSEHNRLEAGHYLAQLAGQTEPAPATHVISGPSTADALLDFVEQNSIDLVMMSAHGYSSETSHNYDPVVGNFISYGSTPLLIIQDLEPEQITPTKAELQAKPTRGGRRAQGTMNYVSNATWSAY